MKRGWIKLYRKSYDHWLYNENRPKTRREAWEDLLLIVNHKNQKFAVGNTIIDCNIGQSIKSLDGWALFFNWDKSKVRRFFKTLEKDKMIITENLGITTRITICKYDYYQRSRNTSETQAKRKENKAKTRANPNNKLKNSKKVNNAKKNVRENPINIDKNINKNEDQYCKGL